METGKGTRLIVRDVVYEKNGRMYVSRLPEGIPDSDAPMGVPVGPPDVDTLIDLPDKFAVRLHNELFARKIFTLDDTTKRQNEVRAALQAALSIDVQSIQSAYQEIERLRAQEE
jgi:hypothetical protein